MQQLLSQPLTQELGPTDLLGHIGRADYPHVLPEVVLHERERTAHGLCGYSDSSRICREREHAGDAAGMFGSLGRPLPDRLELAMGPLSALKLVIGLDQ